MEKNIPIGFSPLIKIMPMAMGSRVPKSPREPAISIRLNLKVSELNLTSAASQTVNHQKPIVTEKLVFFNGFWKSLNALQPTESLKVESPFVL
jgi:hypothetical protein